MIDEKSPDSHGAGGGAMQDDGSTQRDEHSRQYLRSKRFRVLSWLSGGLVLASFFVPNHRVWVLYTAVAVWFVAMLPVFRVVPYNRRIDFHKRSDRRFLLSVAVYVGIILAGVFAMAYFAKH